MDKQSRECRRSSILKLRQSETNVENAINEDGQKFHKRRVSFHNVKTVQNFEKDNLNLLDGSPFKEKIHETMSSDGILSPGKSQVALSAPILTIDNEENASFMNDTMMVSDETNHGNGNVTLGAVDDETIMIFNTQRVSTSDTLQYFGTPLNKYDSDVSSSKSECTYGDYTVDVFENMLTRTDMPNTGETFDVSNSSETQKSLDVLDMEVTIATHGKDECGSVEIDGAEGNIHTKNLLANLENEAEASNQVLCSNGTILDHQPINFQKNTCLDNNVGADNGNIVGCNKNSSTMSQLDADRGFNSTERAMLSVEGVGLSNARGLEHIGANISPYHMKDYSKLMQDKTNGTVHITGTKTRPELYCYVNDSHDETSIIRRDISIVQLGSRFRVSFSPKNDTFSIRSLLDESVCFRKKMLFDTQSLQVNYVNPVNDQIVSNVIREQILEELKRKVLEVEKNSSSKVGVLLQKLNAIYPEKTLALKNMDMRALGSDDHELLRCSRLRAEIEWLHFRLEVSREALLGLKHSIAKDETVLEKLRNNLQICSSKDELSRNVQALQTELDHLPAAEVIAETIDNHIQLVKDETDLERQILDLEIEELRLELRLTKTKSKKFREETIRLNGLANTYEMNYTQFRAIIREIQDSDSCEL